MSEEEVEPREETEAATPAPVEGAGPQASDAASPAAAGESRDSMDLVFDVPLRLSVEVGKAKMLVREVLQLAKGSVIELDRAAGEPADLYVNGRRVGRGDLMVVEDRLAIKLVEVGAATTPPRES